MSPLKPERIAGVDFVVVRELTGGIYFGDHILEERKARDINDYSYEEVERIIRKPLKLQEIAEKSLPVSIAKCSSDLKTLAESS